MLFLFFQIDQVLIKKQSTSSNPGGLMSSSLPSYDLNRLFGVGGASGTIPKDSGGEAMILEEADDDDDEDDDNPNAGQGKEEDSETEEEEKEDSLEGEDKEEEEEVLMSDSLNAVSWSEEIE